MNLAAFASSERASDTTRAGVRSLRPTCGVALQPVSEPICEGRFAAHVHCQTIRSSRSRFGPTLRRRGVDGVLHRRGPVRDAGDPADAGRRLWRRAVGHGDGGQRLHARDGGGGARDRAVQPADRPAERRRGQSGAAGRADLAAGAGARPEGLHAPSRRSGAVHVHRLHADAGVAGRAKRRQWGRREPSPPISPAMSRATLSAGWSPRPSPTASGWPAISHLFAGPQSGGCRAGVVRDARSAAPPRHPGHRSRWPAASASFRSVPLLSGFGIGFCILFAFIGVFTYVNFVLVRPPLESGHDVGRIRLFRFPAFDHADAAGGHHRRALGRASRSLDGAGRGGSGAASAAEFRSRHGAARHGAGRRGDVLRPGDGDRLRQPGGADRGAASGVYLAAYFSGGLVGSAVLGQAFDRFGWPASVAGVGLALASAAVLGFNLRSASVSASAKTNIRQGG